MKKNTPQPPQALVRKSSAVMAALLMLLAGFFLGWQGALLAINQEAAQARQNPAAPQAPGQSGDKQANPMGSMNQMMGQAKALEEKAAKNPGDFQAWVALGNLYFDTDMPQKSIEAYEKALAIKPDLPDVWTDMGVMYRAIKKYGDAVRSFDKALAINPKHEVARLNKGVVFYFDLNDKPAAIGVWNELLAINPGVKMPDGRKLADMVREISGAPLK